ncbi:MAG TPA: LptE family protein [Candidatus Hydrogenedentes bacterium]|nr:LptE family protein [Candidatus Hydrogenedentota bacterium]
MNFPAAGWKFRLVALTALVAAGGSLTGCGYSSVGNLDPKYQTISISPFYDKTPEYGLQAPFTEAITRKFIHDSRLRVVGRDEADLLLEGVILSVDRRGLTYDRNDETTQSLYVVTAGARLTDLRSGQVLWEEPMFSGESTFFTRASGRSTDRLRGNARTFIPTVRSMPTEQENRALSEALEQLATVIFLRVVEPW